MPFDDVTSDEGTQRGKRETVVQLVPSSVQMHAWERGSWWSFVTGTGNCILKLHNSPLERAHDPKIWDSKAAVGMLTL